MNLLNPKSRNLKDSISPSGGLFKKFLALAAIPTVMGLYSGQASALPDGVAKSSCTNYCESMIKSFDNTCKDTLTSDPSCGLIEHSRYFMESCQRDLCNFAPPSNFFSKLPEEKLFALGNEVAMQHLGAEYRVIDSLPVYGPDRQVMAIILTATKNTAYQDNPSLWVKQSTSLRQAKEISSASASWFDANMGFIVLGNQAATPPVVGAGIGLDATYHVAEAAKNRLAATYGGDVGAYEFTKAHHDPFYPILEFSRSGRTFYFSVKNGQVTENFRLVVRENSPKTAKEQAYLMEASYRWFTFLNR